MAVLDCCCPVGFSRVLDYFTGVGINNGTSTAVTAVTANAGRRAGQSAFVFPSQGGFFSVGGGAYMEKLLGATLTSGIFGMAFYLDTSTMLNAGDYIVLQLLDGGSEQLSLRYTNNNVLYVTRAGTLLGTTSIVYPANSYHYIEMKFSIDPSAGVVEVRVDGNVVLSLTGQNTRATANSYITKYRIGNLVGTNVGTGPVCKYCDMYLMSTTGGLNTSYLGDVAIVGQLATANGTTNQFTNVTSSWPAGTAVAVGTQILDSNSNLQQVTSITGTGTTGGSAPTWNVTLGGTTTDNAGANQVVWTNMGSVSQYKLVNEPYEDGDYSYMGDSTVGDISRFTFPAVSGTNVKAVVMHMRARKDDATSRSIRAATKSGATLGDSGADLPLGANFEYQVGVLETDPATGVAWTISGVNAAEFGVKVTV